MADDTELLTGRAGNEAAQGYEPMPMALPVEPTTALDVAEDLGTDHPAYQHLTRPDEGEPVDRSYRDGSGNEMDPKFSVDQAQAASDLARARSEERAAREQQSNADLADALNQLNARDQGQPQQSPASDQPQPETFERQPEQSEAERDAAHAQANAAWAEADQKITEMLQDPVVRERISAELTQIQTQAKAEVDGAWQQVEAAKAGYVAHANALTGQLNALLLSNFPELQSVAGDPQRLAGAVELLKQTNPQRAQQLADFALRASTLSNQLDQQGHTHRQVQQQQQHEAFQRYAAEQDAKAFAKETPESLAKIRNFLYADAEKAGISRAQLEQTWNSTPALRNAFTSELVADGVRWRMSQRALRDHVVRPVPAVQRPGVASDGPRVHEGDLSAAASRFNLPGGNEGTQGLKNAAAWLTARRGRG